MVHSRDDIVGLDSAIIQNPKVWEASGHIEGFSDPLVECKDCHQRFRADHVDLDQCPSCGAKGRFTPPRQFNLMFKTFLGPVENESNIAYLRPETAQGIFTNFENVRVSSRKKLPFGIAQIGKSFRNEITPGNFIFRTREFEQMEMEYFVNPDQGSESLEYWKNERLAWYIDLGMLPERLRLREHEGDELAHYAKAVFDIEYLFPMGWSELEGIAYRGDFDLRQHQEHSGKKLEYFDNETDSRFIPHVVEPASGVDRSLLAFLVDAYEEEEVNDQKRVFLKLDPRLAPFKVAVLPLSKNSDLIGKARIVYDLIKADRLTDFDDTQSIGKRYRRQDEIGTPVCVTIDFDTVEKDDSVTLRDRDTMEQIRVPIADLRSELANRF
jgi:glycyl-tRNA synthetase